MKEEQAPVPIPKRTSPTLKFEGDSEISIHMADEDQVRRLFGVKTNEAAEILLKMALNAFGNNAIEYMELMPVKAHKTSRRKTGDTNAARLKFHEGK